ncbi:MAG: enoyl-CoA hydratase/isomerase family protein [Burkholderiales bacterium]|nr:enoyl-CoA hydratase/isomerase family protein [Burkholderiales bacterium]
MTLPLPALVSNRQVLAEIRNGIGLITLDRANALNALSLPMIRDITTLLLAWRNEPKIKGMFVRGAVQEGKGVAFCAGGDIRFFHQAAITGDARLDDFFSEEYALNHLIHGFPKPYVAWMDGVVMGGGMGISQGAAVRIVTERTKMAMPETNIGFFPDVGGGWFLSRAPGHVGEYLALCGQVIGAGDAIAWGLADSYLPASRLASLLAAIGEATIATEADWLRLVRAQVEAAPAPHLASRLADIDRHFCEAGVAEIMASLQADPGPWAQETLQGLRRRSPLMLSVTLEQIRRGRGMGLADNLRMERDLVRNCFQLRPGTASETVEGIRALAVDKDHAPRWNPASIEEVTEEMVHDYFVSPWPAHAHPLRHLA